MTDKTEDTEEEVVDTIEAEEPQQEEISALAMSDEDLPDSSPEPQAVIENESETDDEATASEDTGNDEQAEQEGDPQQEGQEETAQQVGTDEGQNVSDDENARQDDRTDEPNAVTPEDQLKALFSPFKANGREMQVSSVEDIRTLMQMGANYNKKMEG